MIDTLKQIDTSIFLFLNGHHSPFLDYPMWLISGHLPWIPLYSLIIYLSIKKYGKKSVIAIFAILLTFAFADIISNLVKHTVQRYRPSHNLILHDMVHILNGYRGGMYGFVSSHAANTFGVATIVFFLIRGKYSFLFFLWPVIVTYSRIYLGVHYPSDIIGGTITGIFSGYLFYRIFLLAEKKLYPPKT